jgi:tetratricopeptide (TPR) repeat protein
MKSRWRSLFAGRVVFSLLLVLTVFWTGCTTQRDGRFYRAYHNTTSRFNGFHFARLAMEEADQKLAESQEENWDEVIPLFLYGSEDQADFLYPLMERAIEKCSRVVDRHAMTPPSSLKKDFKRPQLNRWIDDNYTIIGKGHFYKGDFVKAEEVFKYLQRKHKEPDSQVAAGAWLARTYMALENMPKANSALLKAVGERDASDALRADAFLVQADFQLTQNNIDEAMASIERAIPLIKKKKDRARPMFVLAQLKQRYGRNQQAIDLFEDVVKLKTPYEMEFQARMQQALAYDRRGGRSEEIRDLFFDMLDDDKNEEYRDQVFYALAQIELEELNREEGMEYLRDALAEDSGNRRPRMKSFLALADLHLEDRSYELAQAYYDSTLANMDEDHPRYAEVRNNAKSLTELVEQLIVIVRNDSLRELCDLDEDARFARLEDIIDGLRVAQEEAQAEAERLAEEAVQASFNGPGSATAFWPYNPRLRTAGQSFFLDRWGDRVLEDDWRRSRKMAAAFGTIEDVADDVASVDLLSTGGELPTPEELMEGLPCEEEQRADADVETATAVYQSGVIYKEKLEDTDNAIEAWLDLLDRFEESGEHPLAHYQLYRTYLFLEETENYANPFCSTCNSQYWADQISLRYPDSEWAQLVEDPDFVDFEEQRRLDELAAYEAHVIRYYSQKDYQQILTEVNATLDTVPNHTQECRYRFLKAQCIGWLDGRARSRDNYIEALKDVVASCDSTEQGVAAQEILAGLGAGEKAKKAKDDGGVPTMPEMGNYSDKPVLEHYLGVIIPVKDGDAEGTKAALSDFNRQFFASKELKVTSNLLDRENQLVLVKQFPRKDRAMDYYRVLTSNRESMIDFNTSGYKTFVIHTENYVELFKSKNVDGYRMFFDQYYLRE